MKCNLSQQSPKKYLKLEGCYFVIHHSKQYGTLLGGCISLQSTYKVSGCLLAGRQEGHPACKNWVVGCWLGYLSGARCRLAYGPADATATHCLLLIGFTVLVLAHLGTSRQREVKRVCVWYEVASSSSSCSQRGPPTSPPCFPKTG